RARLRRANAPDSATPACGRPTQSFGGFVVRNCLIGSRNCLSCRHGQSTCESASARYFVVLFVLLHSTQEEVVVVYSDRSVSGRNATADWVGCRHRPTQLRCVDPLLCSVPLAVPPLHVDCLDVSRGLRSCRLLGVATRRAGKGSPRGLANPVA